MLQPTRIAGLTTTQLRWAVVGLITVIVVLLPLYLSDFTLFQYTLAFTYAIALLGLNLLIGFNGQFSLGHGAFYALGAYSAAILINEFEVHYLWTILVGGVLCFVVGFIFGFPALRIKGHYLALATLALAQAMPQILKYHAFEEWTGGVQGLLVDKPEAPFGLPLNPDEWLYYLSLFIMGVSFLVAWNMVNSRTGRAMKAIRDHHMAAESMGINTARYKTITFGVSAMFTGVAGALSAVSVGFVAPDSFTVFLSITFVVGSVVGGLASISGALFGGLFIQFIPNLADLVSKAAPWAIYGVLMIFFMLVMPAGIAGSVRAGSVRVLALLKGAGSTSEAS